MAKFLVIYHGSGTGMPHDPVLMAQAKEAFDKWVAKVGNAVVDVGAPVRMVAQVSNSSANEPVDVNGYSIIEAATSEDAVRLLQSHPFVGRGGILQVNELMVV